MRTGAADADASAMRRLGGVYCAAGVLALVLAALGGASGPWAALAWLLGCAVGAAGIGVGLRRHRPARRSFWLCLLGMEAAWAGASILSFAGSVGIASNAFNFVAYFYVPGYISL